MISLTTPGVLTGEQAAVFITKIVDAPLLGKVRVVRIPGTDDRCIADMRAPFAVSRRYVHALASLAGVRPRKARIFLGLERGFLTANARRLLNTALERAALLGKVT